LNYLLIVGSVEGRVPTEQNVQDYAYTPQVALLVVVLLQNLWCDVVGSSELLIHLLVGVQHARSSKVNDGDSGVFTVLVQQQVLRLEISVDDLPGVTVVDGAEYLLADVGCVPLREEFLFLNAIK